MENIIIDTEKNGWCHMVADTIEHLHEFALSAGINSCWYRYNEGWPHYDIRGDNIQKAKDAGATQVERKNIFIFMVRNYGRRVSDKRRARRKKSKIMNTRTNVNFLY